MENETKSETKRSRMAPAMEQVEHMCATRCWHKKCIFFVAAFLIVWALLHWFGIFSGVDRSTYQAVFLTNNQVYFGKLKMGWGGFLKLGDAHYLQVATSPEVKGGAVPPVSLNLINIKNQPQGPLGDIYIPRNQIIFWENLRPDSEAIKVIEQQKTSQ